MGSRRYRSLEARPRATSSRNMPPLTSRRAPDESHRAGPLAHPPREGERRGEQGERPREVEQVGAAVRQVLGPGVAAVEVVAALLRQVKGPQRITRDGRVHRDPQARSRRDERGVEHSRANVEIAKPPQPVEARDEPRLGPDQPGGRKQHQRQRPAARAPELERKGSHHERREQDVVTSGRGPSQHRRAGQQQQSGEPARRRRREPPGDREDRGHERAQRQRAEHGVRHDVVGPVAEQPRGDAEGDRQRMRRGPVDEEGMSPCARSRPRASRRASRA